MAGFSPTDAALEGFRIARERPRKLLVHRRELNKLMGAIKQKGITLIPMTVYFTDRGIAKVQVGLAAGKKKHDKRESEKERTWQRDKARLMRDRG